MQRALYTSATQIAMPCPRRRRAQRPAMLVKPPCAPPTRFVCQSRQNGAYEIDLPHRLIVSSLVCPTTHFGRQWCNRLPLCVFAMAGHPWQTNSISCHEGGHIWYGRGPALRPAAATLYDLSTELKNVFLDGRHPPGRLLQGRLWYWFRCSR